MIVITPNCDLAYRVFKKIKQEIVSEIEDNGEYIWRPALILNVVTLQK